MASSSSRASFSGQKSAPCATMASTDAGGGASGPRTVMVARRSGRAKSTDTNSYSTPSSVRSRLSGVSATPLAPAGRDDFAANSRARVRDRLFELRARHDFVDQPPVDRALALDAFLGGAEHVGVVAPHLALVGDAGEPAGAGQHREQRQFGQRHRRRAVVDQHDVIGGERKLVAAARRGAVDHADGREPGERARILDAVAGLVGELAEVDLVRMGGAGQHADIGAGAEHPRLARAQQDHPHSGMLEAQPLDGVGQLDVDAEIVGVELELVAFEQRALLVDVHSQRRDVAVDRRASNGDSATDRSGNRSGSCRRSICGLLRPFSSTSFRSTRNPACDSAARVRKR